MVLESGSNADRLLDGAEYQQARGWKGCNLPPAVKLEDESANRPGWFRALFPPWVIWSILIFMLAIGGWAYWLGNVLAEGRAPALPDDFSFVPHLPHLPIVFPAFALHDQDNQVLRASDLVGHTWIADFIYTECSGTCVTLNGYMTDLQKDPSLAGVHFVSFSVGPDDGPNILKQYLNYYALADSSRWRSSGRR